MKQYKGIRWSIEWRVGKSSKREQYPHSRGEPQDTYGVQEVHEGQGHQRRCRHRRT